MVGGAPEGPPISAAGTGASTNQRELGHLIREAVRLLEASDLRGANETLKEAARVNVAAGAPENPDAAVVVREVRPDSTALPALEGERSGTFPA